MDSFVFYKSFYENIRGLPDNIRLRLYDALAEKSLFGKEPALSDLETALVNQMFANVKAAHERYDKAKENGAKGGRPRKWIDQEEAEALYKEHGDWKAVAAALDVDEDTLRKARTAWSKKAEKPKNLTDTVTDTDTVTVTDTVTDTVTSISIYKNNKGESDASALTGIVLPNIREGCRWVGEPYILASGRWACHYEDEHGEERTMVL